MQIDRTGLKKGVNRLENRNEAVDCTWWFDSHVDRDRDVRERQQKKNTSSTCGHVLTSEGRRPVISQYVQADVAVRVDVLDKLDIQ